MTEKREKIPGCEGRFFRKTFCCEACGTEILVETWREQDKRKVGMYTILWDHKMPKFCPECGEKIS